ncbi:MAG TPA: hypothetical protein VEJ84_14910 [Acidimicrobiales bacterium]|nr:hypothetical protein [Acidimicrobiales bacterium]
MEVDRLPIHLGKTLQGRPVMGRGEWPRSGVRRTVERADLKLDIRALARNDNLKPGCRVEVCWPFAALEASVAVRLDDHVVTIHYRSDGQPRNELVAIAWTFPHYGGRRPWWLCPDCERRCAFMFLVADHLNCRRCAGLTYRSSQLSRSCRTLRRCNKKALQIGWYPGEPFPSKPPRMQVRTWARRVEEYATTARAASTALAPFLSGSGMGKRP